METMEKTMTGTSDVGGAVARTVDQATGSAHRVIDKASGAARPAVDNIAAGAHQAVDKLAGAATQAAGTLEAKGGQLWDAQARISETCRGYVREKPITSLGIAVAAGFLLNWLIRRR